MARSRVGECSVEGLTRAYTRAHGVPDEWKTRARCRGMNYSDGRLAHAWIIDDPTLNEMAVTFCGMCSVQYECANYALAADEPWGIWSMTHENLEWLKRQRDAALIVKGAEVEAMPVNFVVTRARTSVGSLTAC